jgi:hypothetical protein
MGSGLSIVAHATTLLEGYVHARSLLRELRYEELVAGAPAEAWERRLRHLDRRAVAVADEAFATMYG